VKLLCTAAVDVDNLFVSADMARTELERKDARARRRQVIENQRTTSSDFLDFFDNDALFSGEEETFQFQRAASRLREMASLSYAHAQHQPHKRHNADAKPAQQQQQQQRRRRQ